MTLYGKGLSSEYLQNLKRVVECKFANNVSLKNSANFANLRLRNSKIHLQTYTLSSSRTRARSCAEVETATVADASVTDRPRRAVGILATEPY